MLASRRWGAGIHQRAARKAGNMNRQNRQNLFRQFCQFRLWLFLKMHRSRTASRRLFPRFGPRRGRGCNSSQHTPKGRAFRCSVRPSKAKQRSKRIGILRVTVTATATQL
jgi:hypothetical protein